jgi:hypothetical protein
MSGRKQENARSRWHGGHHPCLLCILHSELLPSPAVFFATGPDRLSRED